MEYRVDMHKAITMRYTDIGDINNDNWNRGNVPESHFQLAYIEDRGFLLNLYSFEKDPVRNVKENGGPVWEDSCLEMFINFTPDKTDKYLNFEFSAAGGMLCGLGNTRDDREEMTDFYEMADVKISVAEDKWDVFAFIPNEFIFSVFGEIDFKEGYQMKANFFKCCEEEGRIHFVTWAPIPELNDFHRPNRFGTLTINKTSDET